MGGVFISILSLFSFISGCSVHGTGIIDEPSSSKSYTITIANTEHGTVSSSIASATANTNVTLTVAPENGYKCTKISVTKDGGGEVDTTPDNSEPPKNYNFKMPESNVTVTATFTAVAPSDGGSGGAGGGSSGGGGAGTTGQALTIEAIASGTISVINPWSTLKYTKNGGALTAYSAAITVAAGDKVCFFAESSGNTYEGSKMRISCTSDCYVYGNIMSLVTLEANATDASRWNPDETSITTEYAFDNLFKDNSHIKNHASEKLCLPATTLAKYCYNSMFRSCTALTTAPALPATELAKACYNNMFMGCISLTAVPDLPATTLNDYCYCAMFYGCTALTTVPEALLPATTLAEGCYESMFYSCTNLTKAPDLPVATLAVRCYAGMFAGCTSLTKAPDLPATTLVSRCYEAMFSRCTSLTTAPELTATTLAGQCYAHMFDGCTSLTTAPELTVTTLAGQCYAYMFQGCTSLTKAPDLPATTLVSKCYEAMFNGCTSLNYIKCLATDISAENCTLSWVDEVAASGTFVKHPDADWDAKTGNDGIPSGWTRTTIITWTATDMAGLKIQFDGDTGETVGNTIKGIKAQGTLDPGSQVEWMKDTDNKINITANTPFPISFTSSDTNPPINIKSIVIMAESIPESTPANWTKNDASTPKTLTWSSGTTETSVALLLAAGTAITNISQIVFTLE